jgi:ankyrin repeat protein
MSLQSLVPLVICCEVESFAKRCESLKTQVVSDWKDDNGKSFLHYAAQMGHCRMCECLLGRYKAAINALDATGIMQHSCISMYSWAVDGAVSTGTSPLALACWSGQLAVVQLLLSRRANIALKNEVLIFTFI